MLLSTKLKDDQVVARKCLHKIFTSIRFLCRQGLPLRGHSDDEGNFVKLLDLRSDDAPELRRWLDRKTDFTSHDVQNEIISQLSENIIRKICSQIGHRKFAIIVDGTQDITGG